MKNIIKNIYDNHLYAVSLYARQAAGTVILLLIARYLSVHDFGLFSSYKNIAVFCFLFANLGFSEYILVSSKADVKEVKFKISIFLVNAVFWGVLTILCSSFAALESRFLFALTVIRTFFDGVFFALILPYFQAAKKFKTIGLINIIYSIGLIAAAVISYIFKLSLAQFLILNIILGAVNFIQCSIYAKINYFLFFGHIKRFLKKLDKSIFAFMGVTAAYFLYAQIPPLYVSVFLSKEDAALYFSAYTIANLVFLLSGAQVQKITPELIKCSAQEADKILKQNLIFVLKCAFVFLVFIIFFGGSILSLIYGNVYYSNAGIILSLMLFSNICCAEGSIYGAYLTASGRQKKKIPIQLETAAITAIGLAVFHKYGLYGAVYAFLLSAVYISSRYVIYTRKVLKYDKEEAMKKGGLNAEKL